ncbi:hypothetical protein MP638_001453 [Amoeboaphelidium occidentale]|nr:hypothetical protein MP638_001453 [Amoeboaphelidium occidentale]
MKATVLSLVFTFLLHTAFVTTLEHEKSFLLQDGAAGVDSIAVYGNSLLLTSSNDIVEKDILTGETKRTFRSHTSQVSSVIIVNGYIMVSAGFDDMLVGWDLKTGSVIRRIRLGVTNTLIKNMAYYDGSLYVCGNEKAVRRISLTYDDVVRTVGLNGDAFSILILDDYIFVGKQNFPALVKISLSTLNLLGLLLGHSNSVYSLASAGNTLISGSADNTIMLWNPVSDQRIMTLVGHKDTVSCLAVIDNALYSGSWDRTIIKWNVNNGLIIQEFPIAHGRFIQSIATKDSSLFSGSGDSVVIKWDTTTGQPVQTYRSRDKRLLAVNLWKNFVISGGEDRVIRLWDASAESFEPFAVLTGHASAVSTMYLSIMNLFSGSYNSTVHQWDLKTLLNVKIFVGHRGAVYSITGVGETLFTAGVDAMIKSWDIPSGDLIDDLLGHKTQIRSLQYENDIIFSGSYDKTIRMWNLQIKAEVRQFTTSSFIAVIHVFEDAVIAGMLGGLSVFRIESGEKLEEVIENSYCMAITSYESEVFFGYDDVIGPTGILFSASLDGSVKQWDMASRRVAFSFENKEESVTTLIATESSLLVGLRNGLVRYYSIENALKTGTLEYHNKSITGLTVLDFFVYSSSLDGTILRSSTENDFESVDLVLSRNVPLRSLAVTENTLFAVAGDSEILILPLDEAQGFSRSVVSSIPLVSLAANDEVFMAGTKSGSILKWNSETLEMYYELKEHTSQINYLLLHRTSFYSASDDATIIQWSLNTNEVLKTYKRKPSNTLGHVGPIKGLSICNGVLFSAGADKTTRRWNIKATRNDDVYFGASAAITSVICYNGSVFSGSDDSAVLMYKPLFSVERTKEISTATSRPSTQSKRRTKAVIKNQLSFAASSQLEFWIVGVSLVVAIFVLGYIIFLFMRKSKRNIPTKDNIVANDASSSAITDLQTLVNSIIGISKHAALIMEHSSFARVKKIAAGGGGELFMVKIMDPLLKKKHGETFVQKIVFVRSKISEEAFYQEVGIMVTLSRFKNFCQIIGYTDHPLSLILKYYDLGSLKDWIRENQPSQKTAIRISRDISKALETMHNHYLAHCDIKTQNILMEKLGQSVSCVLTDFGITQVLSEKIIATRSFNIINIRGLSIQYAAPEALFNFRSKKYNKVDFKMYDIYSFGCVIFEVLTRKGPW